MRKVPGSVYDKWSIHVSVVICDTDILYWSTKSKVGDKPNQSTIDFPAELVDLLKHADVEGKKFTWNLQLNDNTITNLNKWGELGIPRKIGSSCCTFSDSCFTYITNLLRRTEL